MLLLTASQSRALEALALSRQGLDQAQLIARAGAEAVQALESHFGPLQGRRVALALGKGNNAADALAAGAGLLKRGVGVDLLPAYPDLAFSHAVKQAWDIAVAGGAQVHPLEQAPQIFSKAAVCVDGLVGTGARLPLEPPLSTLVSALNASGRPVFALDLPSGVDADSGAVDGEAVRAAATLCFLAAKPGLVQLPARAYVGSLLVADLGVDETLAAELAPLSFYFDAALAARALPPRRVDAHKKQAVVLVVAGSAAYLGAALLCVRGAYRAGAGLVKLALPSSLAPAAQAAFPEAVVLGLGQGTALESGTLPGLLAAAQGVQAAAIGPGLGREAGTLELVAGLWEQLACPAVFDADALQALGGAVPAKASRILTPHDGEFAALAAARGFALSAVRSTDAKALSAALGAVVLRKGPATLVARPDGTLAVNATGHPSLASAGTGDVLTGAIAALAAQGAPAFEAAALGAWLHGRAAELWGQGAASRGLLAGELADILPLALGELEGLHHPTTAQKGDA